MDINDYIKTRLDDQAQWYSKKSGLNKKKYNSLQFLKVVFAVLIPFLTIWVDKHPFIKYVIAGLGVLIAFVEGYSKIHNFKEIWQTYRITAEQLKRQKILFLNKVTPYDKPDADKTLVLNCEKIMSSENQSWLNLLNNDEQANA